MTTLKKLYEATAGSTICPTCGHQGHIEFGEKTKQGVPKSYRVCDTEGCKESGKQKNITGLAKSKHGITY